MLLSDGCRAGLLAPCTRTALLGSHRPRLPLRQLVVEEYVAVVGANDGQPGAGAATGLGVGGGDGRHGRCAAARWGASGSSGPAAALGRARYLTWTAVARSARLMPH